MADDRLQGHALGGDYELCCLDACSGKVKKKDIPQGQGVKGGPTEYWTCESADKDRKCRALSRKPGGAHAARAEDCKCLPFKLKKKDKGRKDDDDWEPLVGEYPGVLKGDDDYDIECFCIIKT